MFSEKIFEDIIVKYPELIEDNLRTIGRQVSYFGKRIDILFQDRFDEKLIVELKKDNLTRNALSQIMEYEGYILSEKDPSARVMLVANRIPLNLKKAMDHHGIEYKEITTRKLREFLKDKNDDLYKTFIGHDTHEQDDSDVEPYPLNEEFSDELDFILAEGGTWEELIKRANDESTNADCNIIHTKVTLKAHINYRFMTQKKTGYLHNMIIDEQGIFPKDRNKESKPCMIGTVANVKSKESVKDRFEIWLSKNSGYLFQYGQTSNPEGIKTHIRIGAETYSIGFHNTRTLIWLSSRLDRDGYSLTELLKSIGINQRDKLLLTQIEDDIWEVRKASVEDQDQVSKDNIHVGSRRGLIVELLAKKYSDEEILTELNNVFPADHFKTTNKQALYGTKRDLGL